MVKLFVWNESFKGGVGHISLSLDGPSPLYYSLWPGQYSAVGPLKYFPQLATQGNKPGDESMESGNVAAPPDVESLPDRGTRPFPDRRHPDSVIEIGGLDELAMRTKAKELQNPDVMYQLFPMWGVAQSLRTMTDAALGFLTTDPFSEHPFKRAFEDLKSLKTSIATTPIENCATSVASILRAGGMEEVKPSALLPWGISPESVARKALDHGGHKIDE